VDCYVSNAVDILALEFTAIEFFDGRLEISFSLVLDETSAIALTADLGVDDVQSRLAGKVFQVL
jgi:hypothetical protein